MIKKRKNLTDSVQKEDFWENISEKVAGITFDSTRLAAFSPRLPELKNIHIFRRNEQYKGVLPNIHAYFVLWICLSGEGRLLIDEANVGLQPHEGILVLPGQPHCLPDNQGRRVEWLLIRFESKDHGWFSVFRNVRLQFSARSAEILAQMLTHYEERENAFACSACGAALLQLLAALSEDRLALTDVLRSEYGQSTAAYIRELCELMIQMPPVKDPFKIVAAHRNVTPEYLHALFRKKTGYTSRKFLIWQKMNLAQHLLVNSELSVSEIALRCGFSGIYPFSRFFSKHSGMSPSAYRKKREKQ